MKNSGLLSFVLVVAVIALGGYFGKQGDSTRLSPNAPSGAVEYFESQDGNDWIALFEDRLDFELSGPLGGRTSIPIAEITSIKKLGYKVIVNSERGQLTFDLAAFSGVRAAQRFKDKLEKLRNS